MAGSEYRIDRLGWQCRIGPGWQCRIGPECRIDWRCGVGKQVLSRMSAQLHFRDGPLAQGGHSTKHIFALPGRSVSSQLAGARLGRAQLVMQGGQYRAPHQPVAHLSKGGRPPNEAATRSDGSCVQAPLCHSMCARPTISSRTPANLTRLLLLDGTFFISACMLFQHSCSTLVLVTGWKPALLYSRIAGSLSLHVDK